LACPCVKVPAFIFIPNSIKGCRFHPSRKTSR
jgi:hypothetical protein